MAASSSPGQKRDPEYRGLIAIGTQRKGNNEKNALDHSLGSSGPVRVGTGLGDHHNDDHHGRQRDNYGALSRERHCFGKTVTYVTRSGKVLDEETVRTRIKVGIPVRVHYVGTGDNVMVDRVILDED